MKKIISGILSLFCFGAGAYLVGCDQLQEQTSFITYYGVVQTLEENDGLFVYIPELGVCDLPSYEEGKEQDIIIQEGDLIEMSFEVEEVLLQETYPAKIATPVYSMTVYMDNIQLETDDNGHILTIDYTQELKDEFLAYEKGWNGDTVYFMYSNGVAGTGSFGGRLSIGQYCSATIENNAGKRISLRLVLGDNRIQDFLGKFATRRLRIYGAQLGEDRLQNFFDLKDDLAVSNIQKIERVSYAGSVSPANRAPTEHKTSTLSTDIDAVYAWLNNLNNETLRRVTEEETIVEGGGAIVLTVYTDLGSFKIYEFGRDYLRIWDSYFQQTGNMTDIVGETVTYTFDSYSDEADMYAGFYMGIIDVGAKVGTTSFAFGEMVCKLSDQTFTNEQFRLVADIGELSVYDGTHFKRDGKTYEIVSDVNFSIVIEEYLWRLEGKERFLEAYEAKYGEGVSLKNYYGVYGNVAIVAKMNTAHTDAVWSETVGEHTIMYNNGSRITVLYNGEFYTLTEAYESGYLTESDITDIALKNIEFYPSLYNWDLIPPVYGEEVEVNAQYESSNNWNEEEIYPSVSIIRSFAEFTSYCAEQGIGYVSYDETYFQNKYLLVVKEATSNSAERYIVDSVYYYVSGYFVVLKDNDSDDVGAAVMGERHCFIELDDSVSISDDDEIKVLVI